MPEEQTPTTPAETSQPSTSEPAAPEQSGTEGEAASPSDAFAGFDFSNMDFADSDETVTVDHTKTEPGQPGPVVQEPPAAPSPTGAPAPTVQTQPTAQPASPTPAPEQQAPPSAVGTGEDPYVRAWNQNQQALDSALRDYYALDDATAEAFLENPKQVLPAILARVHMAVLQNTYKTVLDRLPPLMQQTATQTRQYEKSEDQFFKAWPVFNAQDPNHMNTIMTYGQMFRQQNPRASEADFTKFVGAAAAAHLGLKMPAKGKGNGKGKPLPYNPAAGSAPSTGVGEPRPTQFEDLFNAIKLQE